MDTTASRRLARSPAPWLSFSPKRDPRAPSGKSKGTKDKVERAFRRFLRKYHFHGTCASSARSIALSGMKTELKTDGPESMLRRATGLADPDASRYNYVMSLESAANYAKMHIDPTIIGVVIPDYVKLEKDPQGHNEDEMRTQSAIPPHCIFSGPLGERGLNQNQRFLVTLLVHTKMSTDKWTQLFDRIAKHIDSVFDRVPQKIRGATSFLEMEEQRNDTTMLTLEKAGISFADLKEGQEISFSLDDY